MPVPPMGSREIESGFCPMQIPSRARCGDRENFASSDVNATTLTGSGEGGRRR
jgi:hypothetical protein